MINYDLPWNPNRLEQRFGRIHRIGQTEVCHMWNLVAEDTREGAVFKTLFDKLNHERESLGGRVFDVLGLAISARELKDLLIEAIRYGEKPEVRRKQDTVVNTKLDHAYLASLLEDRALTHDSMDARKLMTVREDMERAEARKLQPHFIESFFLKAFRELGGSIYERESRRYEITNIPAAIRNRGDALARGYKVLHKYERVTFEKELIQPPGKPRAEFICPGHALLDATMDLVMDRNKDVFPKGSILVDENGLEQEPRVLWFLQTEIMDARPDKQGLKRPVSRQMHFVEMTPSGSFINAGHAPYLNYRVLTSEEETAVRAAITPGLMETLSEAKAVEYAASYILPNYFKEVQSRREKMVDKTKRAVWERLTKEIAYWDARANDLKAQELAGKKTSLSSGNARKRADDLEDRKKTRIEELDQERHLIIRPPNIITGAIIIPQPFLDKAMGGQVPPDDFAKERDEVERLAMEAVMAAERKLGREPRNVSADKLGYDIESRDPVQKRLLFIEVKGRIKDATSITVTRNEIMTSFNKPDTFILAVAFVDNQNAAEPVYIRKPFHIEPDFNATSVNYDLKKLLVNAGPPS